ncbi:conserved protein of unknown function [Nitrospira japonica]|uniref:Lipoprotein n=1 Tax=Nitrospira japonica TaxID=1325564 RepID=A0A1W1IAU6_9BACT|nr:conserved protein of unknown function [Nitrospira japonica]
MPNLMRILVPVSLLLVSCAEGRWAHPTKDEVQAQRDWEVCKAEVLAGTEHQKDTMAGSINLSGCMQSKGYRYVEDETPRSTGSTTPSSR